MQPYNEALSNESSETEKAVCGISEELQRKINQLEKENSKIRKENDESNLTVLDLEAKCSKMYSYFHLDILLSPIINKTQLCINRLYCKPIYRRIFN